MTEHEMFRWMVLAAFVGAIAITLPHRIKSATNEKLDRRKEGLFILATLRPAAGVLWLGVMAYITNPSWMAWSSVEAPVGVRWTGVLLCFLALALLLWTLPILNRNLTDTVVTRQHHTLVTRGPYRWIRHPFYVSMVLLLTGSALMATNWFILVMGFLVFALLAIRTGVEEELLLARFGDDYRNYRDRTGKFIPKM